MSGACTTADRCAALGAALNTPILWRGVRVLLALVMAVIAPALALMAIRMSFAVMHTADIVALTQVSWPETLKGLGLLLAGLVYLTSLVTLPATVCLGLPLVVWFHRRRWIDWLRHALAGAVVGALCGVIIRFTVLSNYGAAEAAINYADLDLFLSLAAFGSLSASAYWAVTFGGRRIWLPTAALCVLVIALLLTLKLLY